MKKKVITELTNMAIAVFDKYSVYASDNFVHSFTLVIHTRHKTLIDEYTATVATTSAYPINWDHDYFYHHNTKDIAGFRITFTDEI